MPGASARVAVPAGVVLQRVAAEQRRLAGLAWQLESELGGSRQLAGAMGTAERRALQQLDYMRQALDCLAQVLPALTPGAEVDIADLTRGLPLEDVALRLRGRSAPATATGVDPDFFA